MHTNDRATRLVIPGGVTKVRVRGNVRWDVDATMTGVRVTACFLNGETVAGSGADTKVPFGGNDQVNISSAVFEVSVGGYLVMNGFQSSGGALDLTTHNRTWFSIEVVEPVSGAGDRIWDLGFAKAATATSEELLNKVVVPRNVFLGPNMAGSAGHVDTNPTAQFDVDVTVDNVSIGTISIATDGTFTFATSGGTVQAVTAGSVVRFVAPASTDATVAGIATTLVASLP